MSETKQTYQIGDRVKVPDGLRVREGELKHYAGNGRWFVRGADWAAYVNQVKFEKA